MTFLPKSFLGKGKFSGCCGFAGKLNKDSEDESTGSHGASMDAPVPMPSVSASATCHVGRGRGANRVLGRKCLFMAVKMALLIFFVLGCG